MDPNKKERVGYLVSFAGFENVTLAQDIEAITPYNAAAAAYPALSGKTAYDSGTNKVKVVGVLDSFSWDESVGGPLKFGFYVSTENASTLRSQKQLTIRSTKIKDLTWWIVNFDVQNKVWFEEVYPLGNAPSGGDGIVKGQFNEAGGNVKLDIGDPQKVAPHSDVQICHVSIEVVSAVNDVYHFHFAQDKDKKVVKSWGLKVGAAAATAMT